MLRRKCTALDAIHQERRKVTNQWFKLQSEASSKRRAKRTHVKEIRGRIKTNEIKYEKKKQEINSSKSYFEKINKIYDLEQSKIFREKTQITVIKNERYDITTDPINNKGTGEYHE